MTSAEAIMTIKLYTKLENDDDIDIFVNQKYQEIDADVKMKKLGEPFEVIVAEELFGKNSSGLSAIPESLRKLQDEDVSEQQLASTPIQKDVEVPDYTKQVQDMFSSANAKEVEDTAKDKDGHKRVRMSFIYEQGNEGDMVVVGMRYGSRLIMFDNKATTPEVLYGKTLYRKGIQMKFDQEGKVEVKAFDKNIRRKRDIQKGEQT